MSERTPILTRIGAYRDGKLVATCSKFVTPETWPSYEKVAEFKQRYRADYCKVIRFYEREEAK